MVERQHRARADAGGQRCHHDVHERACAAPPRRLLAVSELTGRVASACRWRPRTLAGLPVPGLAVSGLPVPWLAVPWLAVPRLPVPGLPVPRLAVPGLAVPGLAVSGLLRLGVSGLAVSGLAVSGLLRLAVTTGAVRAGGNAGRQGRNPRASLDRWRRPGIRARRLLAGPGGHPPRVLGRRYCRTLLGGTRSRARDGTLRALGGTFRAPGRTFRALGGACPRVRGRTCPRVRGRTCPRVRGRTCPRLRGRTCPC